ncbi:hypothetical protein OG21DRAFT_1481852 [Imleria badia]|nr:hypothetical protein OG21DRAFT_1481852 [Imleria badia]
MSTAAGAPSNGASAGVKSPKSKDKGKGKGKRVTSPDVSMEEDEDEEDEEEDDEDDDEMEEDDDDDDDEEEDPEINPSNIQGRRTRGVKVDYTSLEALKKAGLTKEDMEEEEDK